MTELLMDDEGRWQRMKEKFREVRQRYYKLKTKILDELNAAGIRISRRSKKIKQSVQRRKQTFLVDHVDGHELYDDDYNDLSLVNQTIIPSTNETDEYEYDNLDSDHEKEDFESIDEIRGICDQIDWNVLNTNVTVYMLTTYLIEEKIVCSLSNVEDDQDYEHICEYGMLSLLIIKRWISRVLVLDFCFANIVCGKHGRCVNTLSGFKCSCSFLYGGILCEHSKMKFHSIANVLRAFFRLVSKQGKQIIIGIVLVAVLYTLSFKPVRWTLLKFIHGGGK